jgi:hypothetical protein
MPGNLKIQLESRSIFETRPCSKNVARHVLNELAKRWEFHDDGDGVHFRRARMAA